jgi:outer membrane protein assembly factor BamD (BamD/ComL family)
MRIRFIASAALAASLFVACAGAPKVIPQDLGARELVQRAQESTDAYNYEAAIAYYEALDERFGSDPLYKTTADYEIAFIAYKQGRFAAAKEGLEALLARYAGPDGATLPPRYAVLSKKVLESIAAKAPAKKK